MATEVRQVNARKRRVSDADTRSRPLREVPRRRERLSTATDRVPPSIHRLKHTGDACGLSLDQRDLPAERNVALRGDEHFVASLGEEALGQELLAEADVAH